MINPNSVYEPRFGGAFFVAGVGQNDLIKTDLIRFGLKGIQQPR
tara:strand:+ start:1729 stop:1860 length:132 start_codon:yes stop_codon:yes gene_type:complete